MCVAVWNENIYMFVNEESCVCVCGTKKYG